ncbi:MAG: glycolate oxidase subunit GlcF [Pseudolabrys sp.]|nr:glycolate oxidase subunit GlcF [Pseudolabrys sp.]
MRTNFSAAQLADPEIAEADAILQTCVHYGFCTNTCPTYVLTRDENDSPRGRIDLMRAMLEKGGAPEPKTVHHLDRCLSCLSCMTTCAVKVDYVHLIDRARVHIERHFKRPLADRGLRALLAYVLPRPRLFLAAMQAGRLAKPLAKFLPKRLSAMLSMVPSETHAEILAPQTFAAEGSRIKRVALLAGCAQQALDSSINAATIRLLQRHGCDVTITAGAGCCGSLPLHMGREPEAKKFATANVEAWSREPVDAIIVNASGCGTTVKDYGHLLATPDALRIGALTRDVTEIMHDIGLKAPANPRAYRVAYHDPCSMQHGQKVIDQPRALLRAAGFVVLDVPEKHFCCGSAGTYNLLQPDMAEALGQRKAAHIDSTDPDIVATGNIGCMTQLSHYLGKPVVHTAELLDWATGGPLPRALEGIALREPVVRAPEIAAASAPATDNFW